MKLRVSKSGQNFYTGGEFVKCWDLKNGKVIDQHLAHSSGCLSMDINQKESNLITGGKDASILIWRLT